MVLDSLKIFNSLTKNKEIFQPHDPQLVKMYVCGPTVYNFLHVGNFRNLVFFNLVRNWLENIGFKVSFALNFTDVDDRIIQRAIEENISSLEVAERYIAEFKTDFAALGLRPHDHNPKVTDHMDDIRLMVEKLIENKKAYSADGDVLFSIKSFPEYGKLSGRNTEDLIAGARVEVDEKKHNPLDFALWKSAKPGEPYWPSAWGNGRPGWHIECSAMIQSLYGSSIDIHGGGMDLMFPHHENEIAQSEGWSGQQFVKYWMHVNMLNFSGQKMSKSLGNFVTMRDFLKDHHSEIYKWMVLSVHYRSTADFSEEAVERAISNLARIYSALAVAETYLLEKSQSREAYVLEPKMQGLVSQAQEKVTSALNDDFNTPEAFAAIFDLIRSFNTQVKRGQKASDSLQAKCFYFAHFVREFGRLMSLFQEPGQDFLTALDDKLLLRKNLERAAIDKLVQDRWQVRLAKEYKKADELREQLTGMGISVMDNLEGSFWEVQK